MNVSKKDLPYTSKLRGVAALLEEPPNEPTTDTLSLDLIDPSPDQPRRYYDPEKQRQLIESIEAHGILEPLLVRPAKGGRYELVAGERRYRAARELKHREVPVIVRTLSDEEAIGIALIENLQRVDLNPIEETEGILKLLTIRLKQGVDKVTSLLYRMSNESKGKVTQNVLGSAESDAIVEVFSSLGTIGWESFVSSRLPLLKLPNEILNALRAGKIEYTKAKTIARVKDEDRRAWLLKEAIEGDLSLSQIKELIEDLMDGKDEASTSNPARALSEIYRELKKAQLWKRDPKKWRKAQTHLNKLKELLKDESDGATKEDNSKDQD